MKTVACFLSSFAFLAISLSVPANAGESEESPKLQLSGPFSHENLDVYLIHGDEDMADLPIMTLEEAMKKKVVVVKETGDVNELRIRNDSKDHYIYVLPGDIIKGGKQDRTLPNGFLLTPRSGFVPVDSFCVEQGRWSKRGGESTDQFAVSTKALAGKDLKLAARYSKSQSEVWKNVAVAQGKLSEKTGNNVKAAASASSLQLSLENGKLEKMISDYSDSIRKQAGKDLDNAVGMAFAINGEFNSADSFASRKLFGQLWPKLLESAATEAVGDRIEGKEFETPDQKSIAAAVADADSGKEQREDLAGANYILRNENDKSVRFDTYGLAEKRAFRVHRNVISRPAEMTSVEKKESSLENQQRNGPVRSQVDPPQVEQIPAKEKKGLLESIGSLFRKR